jgi:hypothetical protein
MFHNQRERGGVSASDRLTESHKEKFSVSSGWREVCFGLLWLHQQVVLQIALYQMAFVSSPPVHEVYHVIFFSYPTVRMLYACIEQARFLFNPSIALSLYPAFYFPHQHAVPKYPHHCIARSIQPLNQRCNPAFSLCCNKQPEILGVNSIPSIHAIGLLGINFGNGMSFFLGEM